MTTEALCHAWPEITKWNLVIQITLHDPSGTGWKRARSRLAVYGQFEKFIFEQKETKGAASPPV
jgi:hypothetical protein